MLISIPEVSHGQTTQLNIVGVQRKTFKFSRKLRQVECWEYHRLNLGTVRLFHMERRPLSAGGQ